MSGDLQLAVEFSPRARRTARRGPRAHASRASLLVDRIESTAVNTHPLATNIASLTNSSVTMAKDRKKAAKDAGRRASLATCQQGKKTPVERTGPVNKGYPKGRISYGTLAEQRRGREKKYEGKGERPARKGARPGRAACRPSANQARSMGFLGTHLSEVNPSKI